MDKKEINDAIRKRIKEIRERRGYEIKYVAEKIGFDSSNLSKIERGDRNVPNELPVKLSEFYNVHLSYFYGEIAEVPEEIEKIGIEWIAFVNEMQNQNLTPEEIKNIVKVVKSLNEPKTK